MLKGFLSYCHNDESKVDNFKRYIHPLMTGENKLLDIWYDRNAKSGDDFWNEINEHLTEADIVCLFLSPHYLASNSCIQEMKKALDMRQSAGKLIIPIVLSKCRWGDEEPRLKRILSGTTDAKEINTFEVEDDGWDDVFEHIKVAAENYSSVKELSIRENFQDFLNDATLLSKAHSQKEKLTLDDIYINQELTIIDDKRQDKKTSVDDVIKAFEQGSKIAIIGDDQSGKSSILKVFFKDLKRRNFIPIYIRDKEGLMQGRIQNRIEEEFKKQYNTIKNLSDFEAAMIVPLVDDFHKAKNKEKVLLELQSYKNCVLMVDDIFYLDIKNEQLVIDFKQYRIRELKPSLRNQLIRKWLIIRDDNNAQSFCNENFAKIDDRTNLVEQSLGKAFGKGIMPAHPFFILYVLSTYDFDVQSGENQNITSQGHCYQALIYFFLRSHGVVNENIDGYINFFTEFAYKIYENRGSDLDPEQYEGFLKSYSEEFNFIEDKIVFLRKAYASGIIIVSSLKNYSFGYPYLYYFFAGKYFSDHWIDKDSPKHEKCQDDVNTIMENLHKTSNAYIAIFIAHHTKNLSLINLIDKIANSLFSSYSPATLCKPSLSAFQKRNIPILKPSLPIKNNAEVNRAKVLEIQDSIEEMPKAEQKEEDTADEFAMELRRSVKTVEVIGAIVKNRAGSIGNAQLKRLFLTGMNVHLRQTSCFLTLVDVITKKDNYSDFLIDRIRKKYPNESFERLREIAYHFFWRTNFVFLFAIIRKIASSLGSNKLTSIVREVCDNVNTPASFMIKHTIFMWSNKNLKIDELMKMDRVLDTTITKEIMSCIITEYCSMHRIDYKDTARLVQLGIRTQNLLPQKEC